MEQTDIENWGEAAIPGSNRFQEHDLSVLFANGHVRTTRLDS